MGGGGVKRLSGGGPTCAWCWVPGGETTLFAGFPMECTHSAVLAPTCSIVSLVFVRAWVCERESHLGRHMTTRVSKLSVCLSVCATGTPEKLN